MLCILNKNRKMYAHSEAQLLTENFTRLTPCINEDGVVTSATGGNGWTIYSTTGSGEVFLMLNSQANPNYPRWQNNSPNVIGYIKTPYKGIITHYTTTQWCDDNSTQRICNHWRITGYNTEENMQALSNGVIIDDNTWTFRSKGASKSILLANTHAFEYYTIHMISNFAGSSYCSMGATKFFMRLPQEQQIEVKKYKLFNKRR